MEGRLPRGFCVKRLTDLPMLWSEQWRAIGLQTPNSGSSRTQLIHPTPFRAANPPCRPRKALSPRFGLSISWAGNRILWAETGGRFQPQNAGERPEFGSQTATRLTNRPELRGFLSDPETASVCRDCMVVDAVPRNRSAEAEFCRKWQRWLLLFFWGAQNGAFVAQEH